MKNLSNETDEMDMDGMGNFSRFPTEQKHMEEFGHRKLIRKKKEKSQ